MKSISYECRECESSMELLIREDFKPPSRCPWCGGASLARKEDARKVVGIDGKTLRKAMDIANEAGRDGFTMDDLMAELRRSEKEITEATDQGTRKPRR